MKDNQLLWEIPSKYGAVKVLVERGLPLFKGDYCMFYNSITKVLSIQNPDEEYQRRTVDLESSTMTSKEDAEFFNRPELADKWGTMKHAFSVGQMAKLLGCTEEKVGVPLIDQEGNFI